LKRGLRDKRRAAVLMLDETIITETPPLYHCYGRVGRQVEVPITGSRSKRVVHGALNVRSGGVLLLITDTWDQHTHQAFLGMVRSHWRGWNVVLFEDRGSPHTAEDSVELADELEFELRWLPTATPELNAMDQLWRRTKGPALASTATRSVDDSADRLCELILRMSPRERLQKAGMRSDNCWLAD
jgi:transposase